MKTQTNYLELAFLESEETISVNELAKLLHKNGLKIGEKRLFNLLRKDGYIEKNKDIYNPTELSVKKGWVSLNEVEKEVGKKIMTFYQLRITPIGVKYFLETYADIKDFIQAISPNKNHISTYHKDPMEFEMEMVKRGFYMVKYSPIQTRSLIPSQKAVNSQWFEFALFDKEENYDPQIWVTEKGEKYIEKFNKIEYENK